MTMLLSIIIPARNEGHHLRSLLESLNQQTLARREYEIIVVADRCEDNTALTAREHGADFVIDGRFTHPGSARNAGAQWAQGKVYIFLDADVRLSSNTFLARLAEFLTQREFSEMVGSCSGMALRLRWHSMLFWKVRNLIFRLGLAQGGNGLLFIDRQLFWRLRGYDDLLHTYEHADIARRAAAQGGTYVFLRGLSVAVSMRRYERDGYGKVMGWWLIELVRQRLRLGSRPQISMERASL